jgi:hypothetical protein
LGVLCGLALFVGELVLAFLRTQRGIGWGAQLLDLALVSVAVLFLIWLYWGVWEMVASAWWSHLFLGPVLVIGLLALTGYVATLAPLIAHNLPKNVIELTGQGLQIIALVLAALEIITIVMLLGTRKLFGVGVKKPLWERVNR